MRGSPFTFSNFSLGLNVLDSAYTLKQGEARDCLNVVSTPRGAIKKRFGSTALVTSASAAFPILGVTDSFERANEDPLSNGGKWEATMTDDVGRVFNNGWKCKKLAPPNQSSAAIWNVAEQTNPAVSVEVNAIPHAEAGVVGQEVSVMCCMKKGANEINGYRFIYEEQANGLFTILLQKLTGEGHILASAKDQGLNAGMSIGISVRGGVVYGWGKVGGVWYKTFEVEDATYTKGYSGVQMNTLATGGQAAFKNFATGEMPASTFPGEAAKSLAAVDIAGTQYLIAAIGEKLYSINPAGEFSEIGAGFTAAAANKWAVVQAQKNTKAGEPGRVKGGPVYLSNGSDAPQTWSGAAKNTAVEAWTSKAEAEKFANIATMKPKYLVYFGNRVWAAGLAGDTSALRWSGTSVEKALEYPDPTSWPEGAGGNYNQFDNEDGSPITGLGVSGPYLLVFKAHKTWVVYDLNEGENRRISDSTGCISHRSIVETPLGTFFLSPDQGVFVTNGTKVQEMSRNVRPILQGTDPQSSRAADLTKLENASATYLNGHYYLSYTAADGTGKTLDYDTALKSWWLHDLSGNQWVVWEPTVGKSSLYTIPNQAKGGVVKAFDPSTYRDSGVTYAGKKFEVTQHSGETISVTLRAYWASCWEPFWQYFMRHRFQQPQIKKRIRTLFVDAQGEVEGYAWRNFGSKPQRLKGVVENADVATEATYGPQAGNYLGHSNADEYQAIRFYSLGTGRVWSFMFGNTSAEPFEVDTYAADLYFRKN